MPILRVSLMIKEGGGVLIHFVSESSPEIFVLCDTVFVCEQQNKLCINLKRANPIVYSTGGARNNLSNVYLFSNWNKYDVNVQGRMKIHNQLSQFSEGGRREPFQSRWGH